MKIRERDVAPLLRLPNSAILECSRIRKRQSQNLSRISTSFLPRQRFIPRGGYTRESVRPCKLNSGLIIAESDTTGLLAKGQGGAVNLILPQTPRSTHDIDFLEKNMENDERKLLDDAARYAERRS